MRITGYEEAIKYLENFIGKIVFKVDPKKNYDPLNRMRVLLDLLDNPQDKFRSILVAGTSGKGSTAYLISHILTTAGYKTGFTLSPHLQKVNERLQINDKQIPDTDFVSLLNLVVPVIEKMKKLKIGAPSYFEILVAMAFKYFADQKVDLAVVEVGMGGEFDATNTLNPLIAILTNVGLDHTNILGNTVEKIAKTKAGIIKRLRIKDKGLINNSSFIINHLPVVTGVRQPTVIKIIEDRCKNVGAKLNLLWRDFDYKIKKTGHEGSVFDLTTLSGRIKKLNDLQLSLIGNYQIENASLAVETVLELEEFGFKISEENIRQALSTAFFPGRFEVIKNIILDGAHNPIKMKAFLKSLEKIFPQEKKIFVIGFKFDKDIKKMLDQIVKIADEIIATQFKAKTDTAVSASADVLNIKYQISNIKYGGEVMIEKNSKKALDKALAIQQSNNLPANALHRQLQAGRTIIIVTGSLYLVGEIRGELKRFPKV